MLSSAGVVAVASCKGSSLSCLVPLNDHIALKVIRTLAFVTSSPVSGAVSSLMRFCHICHTDGFDSGHWAYVY